MPGVILHYLFQGAWDTESCIALISLIWINFVECTQGSARAVDPELYFRFLRKALDLCHPMDDDLNKFFFTDSGGYIRRTDYEDFTTFNNVCGFLVIIVADIECCYTYGETLLLLAAARSDFNVCTLRFQVLVVNGANCFAEYDDWRGPLHMLLRKERY